MLQRNMFEMNTLRNNVNLVYSVTATIYTWRTNYGNTNFVDIHTSLSFGPSTVNPKYSKIFTGEY